MSVSITDSIGQQVVLGDKVVYKGVVGLTLATVVQVKVDTTDTGTHEVIRVLPIGEKPKYSWRGNLTNGRVVRDFVKVTIAGQVEATQ